MLEALHRVAQRSRFGIVVTVALQAEPELCVKSGEVNPKLILLDAYDVDGNENERGTITTKSQRINWLTM